MWRRRREGLFERLAGSTLAAGGYVISVIPSFLIRKEHPLTAVQEMLVVDNMHELASRRCSTRAIFVALPGSVGTVEELVERLTLGQLNRHTEAVIIDIGGFWRPLALHYSPTCVSRASFATAVDAFMVALSE